MYPIAEKLQVSDKNKLTSFLPIRNKGNEFSWETVSGIVLGFALKKELANYHFETFKDDCRQRFQKKLNDPSFWEELEKMYFATGAVFDVSPLFLLFKAQNIAGDKQEKKAANQRMGELFASLLSDFTFSEEPKDSLHFIEMEILDVLRGQLKPSSGKERGKELPYLPYLAQAFQEDMRFLADHPKYLMSELTNTLKLYAFSYCSQLALSVRDWRLGEPKPKQLYFILDVEKASTERVNVREWGYKLFSKKSESLFPVLSALEPLQSSSPARPLWKVYSDAKAYPDQAQLIAQLNDYVADFAISRQLVAPTPATTLEDAFKHVVDLGLAQFEPGKSERFGVNKRYVQDLEQKICGDFITSRGRAGKVLVLNQDQLLLLTNLSIGQYDKLRFFELLSEYERRGFFFDNQTQQVLIEFFERMGNVERMSDSGEAVYVRKTV